MKKLLTICMALCASVAYAEFPDKPLRNVVGYPAGGAGDLVARMVADMITPRHKHPVIVENRSGANGLIGAQTIARGDRDGSGVFQCSMGVMAIVPQVPGATLPIDVE